MSSKAKSHKGRGGILVKRIGLVLAVAISLVLITAGVGYAALNLDPNWQTNSSTVSDYLPPSPPVVTETTIHSDYQKNTDACASCHVAHTGVGRNLLQWASTADACWACHNGTVSTTYNVQAGKIANTTTRTYGGLFGDGDISVADSVYNLSQHGVRSSLTAGAAPGGSNQSSAADSNGQWTSAFTCVSCHNPHNLGGNARILNPDPNGVQSITAAKSKFQLTQVGTTTQYTSGIGYWLTGYNYTPKVYVGATAGAAVQVTSGFTIDRAGGSVTFTSAPGSNVYADFTPALRVTMTVANKLASNETVTYLGGINAFCGACHTDYNTNRTGSTTGSALALNGVYTQAYRHQVGMIYPDYAGVTGLKFQDQGGTQDVVVCLTCHVAHGTNQQYWIDSLNAAEGGTYWNATTAVEKSGSSALKRKPNMAVCETCHKKGELSTY